MAVSPLLIGQGILGGGQAIAGIVQAAKADRPDQPDQRLLEQNIEDAERLATGAVNRSQVGLRPEERARMRTQQRSAQQAALANIRNMGLSPAATAANTAAAQMQYGNQLNEIAARDEALKRELRQRADQAYRQIAPHRTALYQDDVRRFRDAQDRYQQKVQSANALIGAGMQNIGGAMDTQFQANAWDEAAAARQKRAEQYMDLVKQMYGYGAGQGANAGPGVGTVPAGPVPPGANAGPGVGTVPAGPVPPGANAGPGVGAVPACPVPPGANASPGGGTVPAGPVPPGANAGPGGGTVPAGPVVGQTAESVMGGAQAGQPADIYNQDLPLGAGIPQPQQQSTPMVEDVEPNAGSIIPNSAQRLPALPGGNEDVTQYGSAYLNNLRQAGIIP